jgi:hypothetical protein
MPHKIGEVYNCGGCPLVVRLVSKDQVWRERVWHLFCLVRAQVQAWKEENQKPERQVR